jgi:hypothetical protein
MTVAMGRALQHSLSPFYVTQIQDSEPQTLGACSQRLLRLALQRARGAPHEGLYIR